MRFWIILSIFALAACSKEESKPAAAEASKAQAPTQAQVAQPAKRAEPGADWGELGLALLAPGKAPLRKLRRTFEKGSTTTVDLEVKGSHPKLKRSTRYVLTLSTQTVSDDGSSATVGLRIDQATMSNSVQPVQGLSGQYTVDSLGRITDMQIQPPKDADITTLGAVETLEHTFRLLFGVPLPEEDVGEGARWTFHETIKEASTKVARRRTYEVAGIDGSKVEVSVTLEEVAKELGPEVEVKVHSLRGGGTGVTSLDLTKIVPDSAKLDTWRKVKLVRVESGHGFRVDLEVSSQLSPR
jgi:hypothetical protein